MDDLTQLNELDEKTILKSLQERFINSKIYTFTGSILVSINPYQQLPIYDKETIEKYRGTKESTPHVYSIAENAYSDMIRSRQNQSVIISGESGAGKTETTKFILQYLTAVTNNKHSWIQQQILEANTILEAFGNAKTVRNDNSSRFGKFIKVKFDSEHKINGAIIQTFLLEKSRTVTQSKGERNYHVFYQMMAGASQEERTYYSLLEKCSDYEYIAQGYQEISNDKQCFADLKLAFSVLNMSDEMISSIFKILSGILLLGNIKFGFNEQDDKVFICDLDLVSKVSDLLGCDSKTLTNVLLFKQFIARGETSLLFIKFEQVSDNRDSIAKAIYENLFEFIVNFINQSIASKTETSNFIGVLDIFGFELFERNSFEQLCINYTNEKLQKFFNDYIFKLEQEEYFKEGINWEKIKFNDNLACLDMLEGKLGLFALLDEECRFPKGTDMTFLAKINESLPKDSTFIKPKTIKDQFGIKHYAADVFYNVQSFLEKNRSLIQDQVVEMFLSSKESLIQEIFKNSKKSTSAISNFKTQLKDLVGILAATNTFYVRCIKSNPKKLAFNFDENIVLTQLLYSGMLETIKIRKAGFPKRFDLETFYSSFRFLALDKGSIQEKVKIICSRIGTESCKIGKSKIFLKDLAFTALQEMSEQIQHSKSKFIQTLLRGQMARKRVNCQLKAIKLIKTTICSWTLKKRFEKYHFAIITIQCAVRCWFARKICSRLNVNIPNVLDEAITEQEQTQVVEILHQQEQLNVIMERKRSIAKLDQDDVFAFLSEYSERASLPLSPVSVEIQEKIVSSRRPSIAVPDIKRSSQESVHTKTVEHSFDFLKFAQEYFQDHFQVASNNKKGLISKELMILPTDKPITNSLLKISSELSLAAIECFKILLTERDFNGYSKLFELVKDQELKDELFVQLMKQLNSNIVDQSYLNILTACCATWKPSNKIKINLEKFIKSKNILQTCLDFLNQSSLYGERKSKLKELEFNGSDMQINVMLSDSRTVLVPVNSLTTCSDLVQAISKQIFLSDFKGYSICTRSLILSQSDYIFDFYEDPLYFKKIFFKNLEISDPVEYELLYHQFIKLVLCDEFIVSEKIATQMAALKLQIEHGNYDPTRIINLKSILSSNLLLKQQSSLMSLIKENYIKLKDKSSFQCKVIFIETLKQVKLFGFELFHLVHLGVWSLGDNVILAINFKGINFLNSKTLNCLETFESSQITDYCLLDDNIKDLESICTSNGGSSFVIEVKTLNNEIIRHSFQCKDSRKVLQFLKEYFGLKIKNMPMHVIIQPSTLDSDLEKSKLKLLESGSIRVKPLSKPSKPLAVSTTNLPTTNLPTTNVPTTNVPTTNVLTREFSSLGIAGSSLISCQPIEWEYSSRLIKDSLLNIQDHILNQKSIEMFSIFLKAQSQTQFDKLVCDKVFIEKIQGLISLAINQEIFCNEMFLQLIKQSTESKNMNMLSLMSVCLCSVSPTVLVLEYLKCFLRKIAFTSNKFQSLGSFCLKLLNRNLLNRNNEFPPSLQIIKSTLEQKDIFYKFYYNDSLYKSVVFDVKSTCFEVLKIVKEKLKLEGIFGYAIYEKFGETFDRILPNEKLSDVIFKWDALKYSANSILTLEFHLKKRLYLTSNFAREELDLVLFQEKSNYLQGKIFVNQQEIIELACLDLQEQFGDQNFSKFSTYDKMDKYLPLNFNTSIKLNQKLFDQGHSKLNGFSKEDCNKKYLEILANWKYFGSSVFLVEQSYSNQIPSKLYLAVNKDGIHFFKISNEMIEQDPLISFSFSNIVSYNANEKRLIFVGYSTRAEKFVLNTRCAHQIATLLKDYLDCVTSPQE